MVTIIITSFTIKTIINLVILMTLIIIILTSIIRMTEGGKLAIGLGQVLGKINPDLALAGLGLYRNPE